MAPSRPFWKGRRGPRGSFHHYRGKHIRSEFGSIAYRNRGMTPRTAAAATTTSSKIRSWIVVGALFPLWWGTGFDFASGITAGLMLGYIWYVGLHLPAPSLAHSPGLVSLSLEAPPRAASLRAPAM